ncbi:MAG: hypothetical protein ACK4YM_10495 [Novosphingobium sp.]
MIARAGSGWQTVLADLSLILFMATASAVSEAPAEPSAEVAAASLPALGEPVAQWRPGPGMPDLREWLSANPDPRLRLTILAGPEQAQAALALAATAGRPARLVLDPQAGAPTAALTYDQALAQGLHGGAAKETQP